MTKSTLERADVVADVDADINTDADNQMRCPTCGARQTRSDECRRCKCDLSMLQQCWRTSESERRQCLRQLEAGQPEQALRHARRYAAIVGAAKASQLLGASLLLCGDWPAACALAHNTMRKNQ